MMNIFHEQKQTISHKRIWNMFSDDIPNEECTVYPRSFDGQDRADVQE